MKHSERVMGIRMLRHMIHPIEETGISNQSHTVPPKVSSTTGIPNPSLS